MTVSGAVVFITIRFWNVLWAWAEWIDSNLYEVMYPNSGMFSAGNGASQLILDMVSTGLYVIFPLVLTAILGWFGVRAGESVGRIMDSGVGGAGSAGNSLGGAAGGTGQGGAGAAKLGGKAKSKYKAYKKAKSSKN